MKPGDFAKLATGEEIFLPDVRIELLREGDGVIPVHGHVTFAVEDIDGEIIGWATPEVVGVRSVLEWMKRERYIIRCECEACKGLRDREGLP